MRKFKNKSIEEGKERQEVGIELFSIIIIRSILIEKKIERIENLPEIKTDIQVMIKNEYNDFYINQINGL